MPQLLVVIASTRPGRAGLPIANWLIEHARTTELYEVKVADLAVLNLPLLDEPLHPRLKKYEKEHTKIWSEIVDAADAFVFVTPEYNYGVPAPLVNALDYLSQEWAYKPAAFVSYGGVSGGLRSVQMAKQILTTLKIMPIPEAVVFPFFSKYMKDGAFQPEATAAEAATLVLQELLRWTDALAKMR